MTRRFRAGLIVVFVTAAGGLTAQGPLPNQVKQERARAELEVPGLAEVLGVKPGMAAIAAVAQWEYIATQLNGEPIWVVMTVSVPSPWRDDVAML